MKRLDDLAERVCYQVTDDRDKLIGMLDTALLAMNRIYNAGYHAIIIAGGSCDTPEYMYNSDPTVREIKQYLESIK